MPKTKQLITQWDLPFAKGNPLYGRRSPKSRQDFGDHETTVGLKVRRIPYKGINGADLEKDFGIFLGIHHDNYIIGIQGNGKLGDMTTVTANEEFLTLEALKMVWELD